VKATKAFRASVCVTAVTAKPQSRHVATKPHVGWSWYTADKQAPRSFERLEEAKADAERVFGKCDWHKSKSGVDHIGFYGPSYTADEWLCRKDN
jgi:hypothetical protein